MRFWTQDWDEIEAMMHVNITGTTSLRSPDGATDACRRAVGAS